MTSSVVRDPLVLTIGDGDRTMADLLGGKGANLAEMVRLGLPVPPGFTITTAACRAYLETGAVPGGLDAEIDEHLAALEKAAGRRFGDPDDPLLVSVRSGGRFSMPGMMDTVLDVGLTDETVDGLVRRGGERFAWDCYRRLVQMYGRTVLGVEGALFERVLHAARAAAGVTTDQGLDADALRRVVSDFRAVLRDQTGEDLPQDPAQQLFRTVRSVFESWNSPRAKVYRRQENIPDDLGTAVNVVAMVFGNTGPRSGSGVCFTRDPATGHPGVYGDYLADAQGEDVVAGVRDPVPLARLAETDPPVHAALLEHLARLEGHYRDLCDVEFTVEDGHLWVLQVRVGKRTAAAAFRIACQLVDEGTIDLDEALRRVSGGQLRELLHPRFAPHEGQPVATGLAASPGAAVGEVVLDSAAAVRRAAEGAAVVLVRPETSPDDLPGMLASEAIVTARGGLTSHAAVVARGLGLPCVSGVGDISALTEGTVVSVDGTSGEVVLGALPVEPSTVARALEAEGSTPVPAQRERDRGHGDSVEAAVLRLLEHADKRRVLDVRANAETGPDALRARRLGAKGIGLCRTEHTLLGERRRVVEDLVLGEDRAGAMAELLEIQRDELSEVLEAMDGLPVVIRLLDPPLHEFLPDLTDLSVKLALAEAAGESDEFATRQLAGVRRWHEQNPMLGLRGVRLLMLMPFLLEAQVRAVAEATIALRERGLTPRPEIMVPLVADSTEMAAARVAIERTLAEVAEEHDLDRTTDLDLPIGSMIELPRAALTAGRLAAECDFFSFGTNDLTQTTWGMSRDDAEAEFLQAYRENGLLHLDPFSTLDPDGVGRLVELAATEGRWAKSSLGLGACGEHGGDPASILFFATVGLDYVSCSPPRVPIARLEAGRAAVLAEGAAASDTR